MMAEQCSARNEHNRRTTLSTAYTTTSCCLERGATAIEMSFRSCQINRQQIELLRRFKCDTQVLPAADESEDDSAGIDNRDGIGAQ